MSNAIRLQMSPPRSPQIAIGQHLAIKMLDRMEEVDDDGLQLADAAQLQDEYRNGLPYQNLAMEYLRRARATGAEVEEGFMMILSDMAALNVAGFGVQADRYSSLMERGLIGQGVGVTP